MTTRADTQRLRSTGCDDKIVKTKSNGKTRRMNSAPAAFHWGAAGYMYLASALQKVYVVFR